MQKAVVNGFLKIIIISLAISSIFFSFLMGKYILKNTEQSMLYTLALMDFSINYDEDIQPQIDEINPILSDKSARITVLNIDGNVEADTSPNIDFEENHLDREEIQLAFENGIGVSVRYSETEKRNLLYAAHISQNGEYILRLATPYNGLSGFIGAIIPALLAGIIIAFVVASIIGRRLAGGITEPLSEISSELLKIQNPDEKINLKHYKYDELEDIVGSIKILSERIDVSIEKLKYEKSKIDYILDNMSEGLLLIDGNKNVITINKAAMEILKCKNRGYVKNVVHFTQNINIINGISDAIEKNIDSKFDLIRDDMGKIYSVHITRIKKGVLDKTMSGAIVLMIDVTSERESLRIRQDFFSDASHELKTPITSVQGYSELLLSDMEYTPEQQKEFLTRIQNEAKHMTVLINDILMISRLEAGTGSVNIGAVNVGNIIDEILQMTDVMRSENGIEIESDCEKIVINADYSQIYQLINNLVVNAIKYNVPGGKVFIKARKQKNTLMLTVKDTGIGIPMQSQQRVFERFYRVDKGRSRKMGGTGLGLAIVKHIVGFYGGNISLKSKLGEGTEISVKLPSK